MVQRAEKHDAIDALVVSRYRFSPCLDQRNVRDAICSPVSFRLGGIRLDAQDVGAQFGQRPGNVAGAAPDIHQSKTVDVHQTRNGLEVRQLPEIGPVERFRHFLSRQKTPQVWHTVSSQDRAGAINEALLGRPPAWPGHTTPYLMEKRSLTRCLVVLS